MPNKTGQKKSIFFYIITQLFVGFFLFFQTSSAAALVNFFQTSWAGGANVAATAVHPTNDSGYTIYNSKDANLQVVNSGLDLQLTTSTFYTTSTSDTDFNGTASGGPAASFSQTNVSGSGDSAAIQLALSSGASGGNGSDGAVTTSTAFNINTQTNRNGGRTCADGIAYNVTSFSDATTINLSAGVPSGCLAVGDKILLINLQGVLGNKGNVGNYEFVTIGATPANNATTVTLASPGKTKYYGTATSTNDLNIGTATTNQRVIIQRVPQYTNVTINSGGSITASAWDGAKGGVLVFFANGTVTINTGGSINVSNLGYRAPAGGYQGESYNGLGAANAAQNNLGGGAGAYFDGLCNWRSSSGGGYGTGGQDTNGIVRAPGGVVYGTSDLSQKIFLGSAGGGNNFGYSSGAGIFITTVNTINVSGNIFSKGQNTVNYNGAGSGGSIYIGGDNLNLGSSLVVASGGTGYPILDDPDCYLDAGGVGGAGRIYLQSNSISGTTLPAATTAALVTTYYASGTYTSGSIDLTTGVDNWQNLTWAETGGQTITMKVRSADNAAMTGATAFASCTNIANGGSITAGGCVSPHHRYVQFEASLSTSNNTVTPSLNSVTFGYYKYNTSATLTSVPFDNNNVSASVESIFWTETVPAGTNLKFQIRTAPSSSGSPGVYTDWIGPGGVSTTYFDDTAAGCSKVSSLVTCNIATTSTIGDGINDQWAQYKVWFEGDGTETPVLSDVTLGFGAGSPNAPSSPTTTNISDTSMTLNWTDNSNDEIGFVVDKSTNGTSFTNVSTTAAGVTSVTASSLTPNTAYWFRVAATGTVGVSSFVTTSQSTFTKAADPTNLITTASTTNSISLSYSANSNPAGTSYYITGTNGFSPITTTTINPTLLGLTPNTGYTFTVKSVNNDGSQNNAVTVSDYTVPAVPNTLVVSSVSTSSLQLVWNANSNSASTVYYILISDGSSTTVSADTTKIITGLASNTSYRFQVRAEYAGIAGRYSAYSVSSTATTTLGSPIAPTNITTSSIAATSVVVGWSDNSNNETGFVVEKSTNGTSFTSVSTTAAGVSSVTASSLTPNTAYWFRVAAINVYGDSSFVTTSQSVYTKANDIVALSTSASSSTSIALSFSTNSNPAGTVYYIDGNNSFSSLTTTSNTPTLTGLIPNTDYTFGVRSVNNDGSMNNIVNVSDYTAPAIPGTPVVSSVTSTSLSLSWAANDNPATTVYYLLYSSGLSATTTATLVNVNGLTEGTSYQFRVRAEYLNISGTYSSYSSLSVATITLTPAATSTPEAATPAATPVSSGGGFSGAVYTPPAPVAGVDGQIMPLSVLINGGLKETNVPDVDLTLIGGNSKKMAIANEPSFSGVGQEQFAGSKYWNLCFGLTDCLEGEHKVYVRMYTEYGVSSEVLSSSIVYKKIKPVVVVPESNISIIKNITDKIISIIPPILPISQPVVEPVVTSSPAVYIPLVEKIFKDISMPPVKVDQIKLSQIFTNLELIKITDTPPKESLDLTFAGDVVNLLHKFPILYQSIHKFSINTWSDLKKWQGISITLPGLNKILTPVAVYPIQNKNVDKIKVAVPTVPKSNLDKPKTEVALPAVPKPNLETPKTEVVIPEAPKPNIEAPAVAVAIPAVPKPIENLSVAEKSVIPTDVIFARSGDNKIDLDINLSVSTENNKVTQTLNTVVNQNVKLVIKPDKEVSKITGRLILRNLKPTRESFIKKLFSFSAASAETVEYVVREFEFLDLDKTGIYTASFLMPPTQGEYEIVTNIQYKNKKDGEKELRLVTVVDPEGYIYRRYQGDEIRVKDAKITMYYLNPASRKYEVWPADQFKQQNPQVTDKTGRYSFLVPEGTYYVKVETKNYKLYTGAPFKVSEGDSIHKNIELVSAHWWVGLFDWKLISALVILVIFACNELYFFLRKRIRLRKKSS
ncbi:MAG: fibronectin type III domain-containing protein [Patescibacteria group bacterium]|jgi:chitodextrinase